MIQNIIFYSRKGRLEFNVQKASKIIKRISIAILIVILSVIVIVLGGLNIAKFFIYSDYYSLKTDICTNPGLSDGFVCQGICADEENNKIFVSGYMKDNSASRVYITDINNNSYYVKLTSDGEDFTGHAGGISLYKDTVYLADDEHLYTFPLTSLTNAENGDTVDIGKGTPVNNQASFCYADENYVYVGEFHDGGAYITNHPYETPDGTYYAIVSRYSHDDLEHPNKIYSIRNKVQGICFTPDGKVVLSTSYGLADSVYYVYNESEAVDSGKTFYDAPVYYLTECIQEIKGPAMAEGLDYFDGKVITLTESASDKYIFGKFFFANKIIGFDI